MTRSLSPDRSVGSLLVAPLLVVAAATVWIVSNQLVVVGPFDRAQIGWGVAVPLFLLAPGAAALAGRRAGGRGAAWIVVAISATLGLLTAVGLALTMTRIGCAPVGPLESVVAAIPVGLAAALGFAMPAGAAWAIRSRGALVALATAAALAFGAIFVTILAFAATYVVGVSCAAPG